MRYSLHFTMISLPGAAYLLLLQILEMFASIPESKDKMTLMHFRFLIGVFVSIFGMSACVETSNGANPARVDGAVDPEFPIHRPSLSLTEIAADLRARTGEDVKVRGYLANFAPALILVAAEDSNVFDDPAIVVTDQRLRATIFTGEEFTDESEYLAAKGCRDRFVEITGVVGFLEAHKSFGIVEIRSILVFEDGSFSGEGRECFLRS